MPSPATSASRTCIWKKVKKFWRKFAKCWPEISVLRTPPFNSSARDSRLKPDCTCRNQCGVRSNARRNTLPAVQRLHSSGKSEGKLKRDAAFLIDALRCIGVYVTHSNGTAATIGGDVDDFIAHAREGRGLKLLAAAQHECEFAFIGQRRCGFGRLRLRWRLLSHLLWRRLLHDDDGLLGLRLLVRVNRNDVRTAAIEKEKSGREARGPQQPLGNSQACLRCGIDESLDSQVLVQRRQMFKVEAETRKRIQQILDGKWIADKSERIV